MPDTPTRQRVLVASLIALAAVAAFSSLVHAESTSPVPRERPRNEIERWIPSAALVLGISGQGTQAAVLSGPLTGSAPPEPVRPPASGSQKLLNPRFEGQLELMSPRLLAGLGQPRAFAQAAFGANFGFAYDVAREGTPGELIPPTSPIPEGNYPGQGSRTTAKVKPFDFKAGLGAAFTVELADMPMRIKPSVQYLRQTIQVNGLVNRAVAVGGTITTDFRVISLSSSEERAYNALGPAIEVEVDASRMGPVVLTPFVNFQAFAILDNDPIVMADSFTDATGTETAAWFFKNKGWIYSGAVGLRFRWQPE